MGRAGAQPNRLFRLWVIEDFECRVWHTQETLKVPEILRLLGVSGVRCRVYRLTPTTVSTMALRVSGLGCMTACDWARLGFWVWGLGSRGQRGKATILIRHRATCPSGPGRWPCERAIPSIVQVVWLGSTKIPAWTCAAGNGTP